MKFDATTLYIYLALAALAYVALYFSGMWGNKANPADVGMKTVMTLVKVLPLVVIAYFAINAVMALIPKDITDKLMGSNSGFMGIVSGYVLGILLPGAPIVDFPVALSFLRNGAGIGMVVTFLLASRLSITYLPIEWSILGSRFTVIHYISNAVTPLIAGLIANCLYFFMKRFIHTDGLNLPG